MTKLYIKRNLNELAELAFGENYTCDIGLAKIFYLRLIKLYESEKHLDEMGEVNLDDWFKGEDEFYVGKYDVENVRKVFDSFVLALSSRAKRNLLKHMEFRND